MHGAEDPSTEMKIQALKVRNIQAQGNALGQEGILVPSPERA